MLVLSRKQDQEVLIGDQIKITVLKTRGNTVRLGIEAPRDIKVVRGELDAEPKSNDDHEANETEFTIVFGSDSEVDQELGNSECVQFNSNQTPPTSRNHVSKPVNRLSADDAVNRLSADDASGAIRFEGRLPRVLKHNRLKEIVDRIAVDKAASGVKE